MKYLTDLFYVVLWVYVVEWTVFHKSE